MCEPGSQGVDVSHWALHDGTPTLVGHLVNVGSSGPQLIESTLPHWHKCLACSEIVTLDSSAAVTEAFLQIKSIHKTV